MAARGSHRPVTLETIASKCRVAKSTVSLALRGDSRVESGTAKRIRAAAAKLGYDPAPHDAARRLALRKTGGRVVSKVIGLLCEQGSYAFPFYSSLLHGLLEGFGPAGFNVVTGGFVRAPDGRIEEATSLEYLIGRGDLDGLVYYSEEDTFTPILERARRTPGFADRPVVSLLFPAAGCSSVLAAEEDGANRAAAHLLELGHTEMLLLGTASAQNDTHVSEVRWRGVRGALSAHGRDPKRHLHFIKTPRSWVEPVGLTGTPADAARSGATEDQAAQSLVAHIRAHPRVTAIIAQNDSTAHHAWHALYRAGLRVPGDVSIVGFDDTDPLTDESGKNLLTTVHMPLRETGRRAAELVARLVENEGGQQREILLPTELIVRESTSPPRRRTTGRKGAS